MQTLDKNLLTNYPCASSSMQWQMHHNMSVNPYNQHFVTPCLQLSHLFLSVATLRKHESNDAGKDNPLPSKTAQTRSPQINATTIEAGFLDSELTSGQSQNKINACTKSAEPCLCDTDTLHEIV